MSRENFEIRAQDGGGRIGELTVPRAGVTVETPALLPVVNPHMQTVEPSRLESEFGADILITNSYILFKSEDFRDEALEVGLHELLDFDGAIMTDSGSFQLAEYGEITVTTEEILQFQHDIGSDIGTPVDIPTPPDVDREQAEDELATTQERLELAETVDVGDMLINAPVQGSTFPDLREAAGRHAEATSLGRVPGRCGRAADERVSLRRYGGRGRGSKARVGCGCTGSPVRRGPPDDVRAGRGDGL